MSVKTPKIEKYLFFFKMATEPEPKILQRNIRKQKLCRRLHPTVDGDDSVLCSTVAAVLQQSVLLYVGR